MGADVRDRDGALWLMDFAGSFYPWLRRVFADGGYAGDKLMSRQLVRG